MSSDDSARLDARRAAYSSLSSTLAHLDDAGLRAIVPRRTGERGDTAAGTIDPRAWGVSGPGAVDEVPVFVKRVPLTEVEHERAFSTRNHFRMPTFYNYGVGSAGFGAWRELVAHIKTTNWVLEGACVNFPLLLHWRVLRRNERRLQPVGATSDEYFKRWNSSKTIANYMYARAAAPYELWLVLEHVPHMLAGWLPANQERIDDVIAQMLSTFDFLRARGVVHFDAHFANVVTDGETCYLTDYGLVNDARFDLTDTERTFLARHAHYDYAEFLSQLGSVVAWCFGAVSSEQRREMVALCGLTRDMSQATSLGRILDRIDVIVERKLMPIEPKVVAALEQYRSVIVYMLDFLPRLGSNPRKDDRYDDDFVRAALVGAGMSL